jgi:predicted alpha/beta-fold hydrolase
MPAALLVHGLGGHSQSGYVRRVGSRLFRHGVRVVRIDLRGTGAGSGLAEKFYHAGRSDDVRAALAEMHRWAPESPLWLIGFSLGGNLALKLGGEGRDAEVRGLARIVAVAPPIDIVRCSELMSHPRNRLYDRFFARRLVQLAQARAQQFPNPPLPEFPKALSLRNFDDLFTAPRCGFNDAMDYYRRASSVSLVPLIPVPTLIVSARDDPFVAVGPLEELRCPSHIRIEIQEHGGHLGFLGATGDGSARWVEKRIVDWLVHSAS